MENQVDKIMKRYYKDLKAITPEEVPQSITENNSTSNKNVDENSNKKFNLALNVRHIEKNIEIYKEMLDNKEITGAEYKEFVAEQQKELDKFKKSLNKITKEEEKSKKQLEKKENNRKAIIERNLKIREKLEKVHIARDDAPLEQKYNIYINDLRTKTIVKLNEEKKQIDIEMQKTELLVANNKLQLLEFKIEYEEKDGVKIPTNGQEYRKLQDESYEYVKELKDLREMKEQCDSYLKELHNPLENIEKSIKILKTDINDLQQDETTSKPELKPQTESKQESKLQPPANQEQEQEESKLQPPANQEQEQEEQDIGFNSRDVLKVVPKITITLGANAEIRIDSKTYMIDKKTIKKGLNLQDNEVDTLLKEYIPKKEEQTLVKELIARNEFDISILNNLYNSKEIAVLDKKLIAKKYLNKCLLPKEENDIAIEYDCESLTHVSLFNRLFDRFFRKNQELELNNNDKFNILKRAMMAERQGIAKTMGEYKLNWKEKLISKITGQELKAFPTQKEIAAAWEYNSRYYKKDINDFKENLKVSKQKLKKDEYYELKSLIKEQEKQDKELADDNENELK